MKPPAAFLSFLAEQPQHTRELMREVWNGALDAAAQAVYAHDPCICLDIAQTLVETIQGMKA